MTAAFLACALIAATAAAYDVQMGGLVGKTDQDGDWNISTFWGEDYRAISSSASVPEGEVVADTTAFDRDRELAAGSFADASGRDATVNSTTYVDGSYVGTIATARARGGEGEGAHTSAFVSASSAEMAAT